MTHLTANLNAVFTRTSGEQPVPTGNNTPGPGPTPRPASAPIITPDARDRGNTTERRRVVVSASGRQPRPSSPAPSDVGSMPELETVSDSSEEDDDDDSDGEGRYWRDDDDPPGDSEWSSEDEDEDQDGAMDRIELVRVVEAIRNITLGASHPAAVREQDILPGHRDDGLSSDVDDVPYESAEEGDSGMDFREPPPPLVAFNSDEDEEAVPIGFLTALAAMSGMIGSDQELGLAGDTGNVEEDDDEEMPPLEPISRPTLPTSRQGVTSSTEEPPAPPTAPHVDVPSSSSSMPTPPAAPRNHFCCSPFLGPSGRDKPIPSLSFSRSH